MKKKQAQLPRYCEATQGYIRSVALWSNDQIMIFDQSPLCSITTNFGRTKGQSPSGKKRSQTCNCMNLLERWLVQHTKETISKTSDESNKRKCDLFRANAYQLVSVVKSHHPRTDFQVITNPQITETPACLQETWKLPKTFPTAFPGSMGNLLFVLNYISSGKDPNICIWWCGWHLNYGWPFPPENNHYSKNKLCTHMKQCCWHFVSPR